MPVLLHCDPQGLTELQTLQLHKEATLVTTGLAACATDYGP